MPFDIQGARAAGYRDDEIVAYLGYSSGEPIDTFAGTDEEKIAELLRRRQRKMLPVEYAEQTPFDRAVAQPPEPEPDYLSRPDATFSPEVPEEAVLPAPVRTARDWFRSGTMPVMGGPEGITGLSQSDFIPEGEMGTVAMLAGGVLPPGIKAAGKLAKKAPAILKGLTGKAILKEAASAADEGYKAFTIANPEAGATMFDLANAAPAMEGRPPVPRYIPPRGVPARVSEALADPAVGQTLRETVELGGQQMPESWYRTGPLFEHFVREYGDDAPQAYERFMQMVAATSTKNPVPSNIRTASYYNWLASQGLPIRDVPAAGYGNLAQKQHVAGVRQLLETGGLDPLQSPKRYSFAENLLGNELPVTVDTHNMRMLGIASEDPRFLARSVEIKTPKGKKAYYNPQKAYQRGKLSLEEAVKRPTYWESAPKKTEYAAYERAQQAAAREMGITPAAFQERMWVGGGPKTGLMSPPEPFLRTLASRIHYTASRMGVTPEVVLDQFVKGKIPLLGLGAGALALNDEE